MTLEEDAERRELERVPVELRVEYRRLNSFFADYTKNISKGGIFIRTGNPLVVGTGFVFVLTVPKLDNPLRLAGRVKWVVEEADATEEQPVGMGIQFEYANTEERERIEGVVEQLVKDELGDHISDRLLRVQEPR